jgi:hypothetical protein
MIEGFGTGAAGYSGSAHDLKIGEALMTAAA